MAWQPAERRVAFFHDVFPSEDVEHSATQGRGIMLFAETLATPTVAWRPLHEKVCDHVNDEKTAGERRVAT
jgi:hypothetical protein